MLLKDLLDGPDGVRFALVHASQELRFHLDNTVSSLVPLFWHPLSCSQDHLFFLELFVDFVELVYLLFPLYAFYIEAAFEILAF